MNNCVIERIAINSKNNGLKKLGCIRMNMDGGSVKNFFVRWDNSDPTHAIRVITEGEELWNSDFTVSYGREVLISDTTEREFYVKNPCTVEANDKYNLKQFVSTGGAAIDVSEFGFTKVTGVWGASNLLLSSGNINDLATDIYITFMNIVSMTDDSSNGGDILDLVRGWVANGRTSGTNIGCLITASAIKLNGAAVPNSRMKLSWNSSTLSVYQYDSGTLLGEYTL